MSREYGIAQAMVEYAFMNFGEEVLPVVDDPGRDVQLEVEVAPIAARGVPSCGRVSNPNDDRPYSGVFAQDPLRQPAQLSLQ